MNVNEDEDVNVSNSFSEEDKKCLQNMKERMDKTENKINEIAEQIQNLTESVNVIQKNIEEKNKADLENTLKEKSLIEELHTKKTEINLEQIENNIEQQKENINEDVTSLAVIKSVPVKKKAKRYKEKTKEDRVDKRREHENISKKEPIVESKSETRKETKKSKFGIVGEVAFYLLLIVIVLGAFLLRSNSSGQPTSFAGYSLFTVLTSSMESEIPKGSLVITKNVDPKTLQIGDDITFMAGKTTTITHRIIAIMESYQNTGERAFQTQGVMNKEPDQNMVPAVNVIGKVIWHSKVLGDMANFLGQNLIFLVFVVVVLIVFINVMKNVFKNDESKQSEEQTTKQEEKAHKRRTRGKGKREK